MRFTPGPWEYDPDSMEVTTNRRDAMDPRCPVARGKWAVADVGHSWAVGADDEALNGDGRLIAAAPEMLHMLQVVDAVCSAVIDPEACGHGRIDWANIQASVRAALAKARGEA